MVEVCKCLKCSNSSTRTYTTGVRGYGSKFDTLCNLPVLIHLCEECSKEVREEWFTETPTINHGYIQHYLYEKEIVNFIESLPRKSRQLITQRQFNLNY